MAGLFAAFVAIAAVDPFIAIVRALEAALAEAGIVVAMILLTAVLAAIVTSLVGPRTAKYGTEINVPMTLERLNPGARKPLARSTVPSGCER